MALDKFGNSDAEVREKPVSINELSDHQLIEATKRGNTR